MVEHRCRKSIYTSPELGLHLGETTLYDSYQERKSEWVAKFKVKEAGKKNVERDTEWGGFGAEQSDNVDEGEERWEVTANAKARGGEFLQ